MFLKSSQFIKIFILAFLGMLIDLHAMEQNRPDIGTIYGFDPGYIWVSHAPGQEAVRMLAKDFAKEHGFNWTESLLYDRADALDDLIYDSNSLYREGTSNIKNAIFSAIARNKDKLVLSYMNESVGWGLFAREDIIPNSEDGYTFIAFYGSLLRAYGPKHPRDKHGGDIHWRW